MVEYNPEITGLHDVVSLKRKGEGWQPDIKGRVSIESLGFVFGETLGEGAASKVKKAFCTKTKKHVAIKIINKSKISDDILKKFVWREISILQNICHPGIVDVYNVYETKKCVYLITELVPNGNLLDFVTQLGHLNEADARRLFHQLLDIVSFLHDLNICHRDLKLENLLLDEYFNLKLIDFGFAKTLTKDGFTDTTCGSYVYTAPEVLNGERYNGMKVDIWSMGVCLYAMLCGKLPFRDDDVDILRCAMFEKLKFYKYVSKDCRSLLQSMLSTKPSRRPTILQIRKSEWMCRPLKSPGESSISSMSVATVISANSVAANLDPNTEHGFTCDTHNHRFKSSRVTDVLRSVAENHSTGRSSIDLTKVPVKKASSVAMVTGISGPVGRKISQQLGLDIDTSQTAPSKTENNILSKFKTTETAGNNKSKFGKAMKAMKTFRTAATVVKAVRRFKRKPILNTILNMPQEEAMHKMLEENNKQVKKETRELHHCTGGKVATICGEEKRKQAQHRRQSSQRLCQEIQIKEEKREIFGSTLVHLLPDECEDFD